MSVAETRPATGGDAEAQSRPPLNLAFGLTFADLYRCDGLFALDKAFLAFLAAQDAADGEKETAEGGSLSGRLREARHSPQDWQGLQGSELILALAEPVEAFLARLFGLEGEVARLKERHRAHHPLYRCRRLFVQRLAARAYSPEQAASFDGDFLRRSLEKAFGEAVTEESFARHVEALRDGGGDKGDKEAAAVLELAARYAAWALYAPQGQACHGGGVVFHLPKKLDPWHLVDVEEREAEAGTASLSVPEERLRHRDGFTLTDHGMDLPHALAHAHYCIFCHKQGKDSCAKGFKGKGGEGFRLDAFGAPLAGCPLEEKISEMNSLKSEGFALAALAVACVDNPMVAGTGHRICNDCMKSCIYQKQEPVDIPQVESRVLRDVLALPWGFELYSLLTRWNPLNFAHPAPKPRSGRRVLVAGLGPAGYTLAHYLMNDGHEVVAVDGLKIEPLPASLCGVRPDGSLADFTPVADVSALREDLDHRVGAGFGGVAEYGITVRWDKNYLTLIRLLLERRRRFAMYGGVRLGSTLTVKEAFALGFDHVALCLGAGRPKILSMANGLARGVRQASDFLMALQLTGAARDGAISNLQLRMPVVVIGGGLTAIDTATEAMAYYPRQVEKFLERFETLAGKAGDSSVMDSWDDEERGVALEFLKHGRALRRERALAAAEGRAPAIAALMRSWGGVTIAYRKRLVDSPAYRLNYEEVAKAFEEGMAFAPLLAPRSVEVDAFGHAEGVVFGSNRPGDDGGNADATVTLPARSVLVAVGTRPNTVLESEEPGLLAMDGQYFRALDEEGGVVSPEPIAKPKRPQVLASLDEEGRGLSFFGDLHPSYAGNVVRAMASARQGYGVISRLLARRPPASEVSESFVSLTGRLNEDWRARVASVERLTPSIVEVVLKAPAAARRFRPGQFYRLQNYERCARACNGTTLAMEGLALTGAWVDRKRGLLSTIVLEMGGSSDVCRLLTQGEPVALMGPTGAPTEIPENATVLLAGGGLGNAVLFSIGAALRASGCRVLYFAAYRHPKDRYKVDMIESVSDCVVWSCDSAPGFTPSRPSDKAFVGDIIGAMEAYGRGRLGETAVPLREVERMIVIGSDGMMAAVAGARRARLKGMFSSDHVAIGSINSPMQCMMKEICAQCLQIHRAADGSERVVFSCSNQDQPLDVVDFASLSDRLRQNAIQEKLTALWIRRCLMRLS